MIGISFEFLAGLVFGIEHDSGYTEDAYNWLVAIHLGFMRLMIINFKQA